MAWPTDNLDTTNLDAGTDSPALARPMLARLIGRVKSIIASRGVANGVASLDGTGKIPVSQLPSLAVETQIYDPAGAYSSPASGSHLLQLTASIAGFRRLRFEMDSAADGWPRRQSGEGGIEDPGRAAIPYAGFGRDYIVYRGDIPASGSYLTVLSVQAASDPVRNLTVKVQGSGTTLTLLVGLPGTSGVRLYGIWGLST